MAEHSQVYMAMESGLAEGFVDGAWWAAWRKEKEAHTILNGHVDLMKNAQSVRYTNWRKQIAILEWGFKASQYETVEEAPVAEFSNAYNAALNICETIRDEVAYSKIVPMPLTQGGGYLQRQQAKRLQKALEGTFDENDMDLIQEDAIMDALACGAALAKVFRQYGRIRVEHVPTEDIIVDDGEGRLRKPRSIYQVTRMDRFVALELYGADDPELHGTAEERRRRILNCPADRDKGSQSAVQMDQIRIVEAWHLPSCPVDEKGDEEEEEAEAKQHDGRHAICIDGCTLVDEPWHRDHFPFATYVPRRRRRSFWGLSLIHALAAPQQEYERVTRKIQNAHQKMGGSHFAIPRSANVNVRELDNDEGTVVEYDGNAPPHEWSPAAVNPQTYEYQQQLPQLMKDNHGVPSFSTSGQLPAGLTGASGKALQLYEDVTSKRLRAYHRELERFTIQVAQLIIQEAHELVEAGESYEVKYATKRAIEKIDWKDVLLEEDEFVLRVFPVSALASTPSAKFAQLQEMLGAGAISIEQFKRLYGLPDLEAESDIDTADTDVVDHALDKMFITGKYISPEPFDNLALAKSRAAKYYNMRRCEDDVPEDRLELIRNYIQDCDALEQQAAQANQPAPGAPPPLNPPAGGGAPPPTSGPAPGPMPPMPGGPMPS